MKSDDALLAAWEKTLARKGEGPAVFDPNGEVQRTFREIEKRARELEGEIAGPVHRIDIGNHPDWPSHLLAAVRRRLSRCRWKVPSARNNVKMPSAFARTMIGETNKPFC